MLASLGEASWGVGRTSWPSFSSSLASTLFLRLVVSLPLASVDSLYGVTGLHRSTDPS